MSILLSVLAGVSQAATPAAPALGTPELPRSVSVIQLVANPDGYNGQTVLVRGFVRVEPEGNMLCLGREDAEAWQTKNCVWLDLDYRERYGLPGHVQQATMKHAIVVGVFNRNENGHFDCCSGEIERVARIQVTDGG